MDVHRINVKFYFKEGHDIDRETWFRVFNTWISTATDEVLVDVADYSHVHAGPVVLLVGHEANYSIDNTDHRLGLLYSRKQPLKGNLYECLRAVLLAALKACLRLEEEPELRGRAKFRGDETWLVLNDRLNAPNTEDTFAAIGPDLKGLLNNLYAGAGFTIGRNPNQKQLFSLNIKAEGAWDIPALLKNIEARP
jgi:hypothetical protein